MVFTFVTFIIADDLRDFLIEPFLDFGEIFFMEDILNGLLFNGLLPLFALFPSRLKANDIFFDDPLWLSVFLGDA